jgi:hypothetical protein
MRPLPRASDVSPPSLPSDASISRVRFRGGAEIKVTGTPGTGAQTPGSTPPLRDARRGADIIVKFIRRYNREWLIERAIGHRRRPGPSPGEGRLAMTDDGVGTETRGPERLARTTGCGATIWVFPHNCSSRLSREGSERAHNHNSVLVRVQNPGRGTRRRCESRLPSPDRGRRPAEEALRDARHRGSDMRGGVDDGVSFDLHRQLAR